MESINSKFINFSYLTLASLAMLICTKSALADISFSLYPNDEKEVHCDHLTMKDNKINCQDNQVSIIYPLENLAKIIIYKNSEKYEITSIHPSKYPKLKKAINLVNEEKVKSISEGKKRLAEEKRKKDLAAQMSREKVTLREAAKGGEDIMARCQRECSKTKYSYDTACFDGCLFHYMLK